MSKAFIVDEYCDFLDPSKICDNCGACLNLSKTDLQAIKIEEIAKNIDENEIIEEDLEDYSLLEHSNIPKWEELVIKAQKIDPNTNKKEIENMLLNAYSELNEDFEEHLKIPGYELDEKESFIDAFDKEVIYLEDVNISEDDLENDTEEIFPGVRKLK
ncbi:hypothetical protein [uncultured Clostridium sp.]|uniref:hypothetical protein n=1 Tax=uncultured Clostridium sp. TaxID=59620 RepID=UPI0026307557|nr:hypothetical protein [uncultured Clostridium sp.]